MVPGENNIKMLTKYPLDYNHVTAEEIHVAKENFDKAIKPSNSEEDMFLTIAHDIHPQTAKNLTGHMLDLLVKKGYKGVTMGECLGDDKENWYRGGSNTERIATSAAVPTATPTGGAGGASDATPTNVKADEDNTSGGSP